MTTMMPAPSAESVLPHVELRLSEDLDISTLPMFRDQLEDALSLRPERVVIDFSACRYLDAQAIRVLLDAHGTLWRSQGRLVLRDCSPETTRLLALAGVLNVFEIEQSARAHDLLEDA
jgi:anti-anti-sigma factor